MFLPATTDVEQPPAGNRRRPAEGNSAESGYRERTLVAPSASVTVPYRPDVSLPVAELLDAES
ncbi:MAG: hypothetical protein S0880_23825 [Actinomycetota bacterium]|nr:hypothetical protein [Actinomycetota bacterium]